MRKRLFFIVCLYLLNIGNNKDKRKIERGIMIFKKKKDPFTYQGVNKNDNYFEGWYFKHVTADLKNIISIIPGISKGRDSHAFIQVIITYSNNGNTILKMREWQIRLRLRIVNSIGYIYCNNA